MSRKYFLLLVMFVAILSAYGLSDAGTTERVSVNANGTQGDGASITASISADGRYVAFCSGAYDLAPGDTNFTFDVFVHDRLTGTTERVSVDSYGNQADFYSTAPSISGDGRYVAFASIASNLVPGDTNEFYDIFVHDRLTGTTACVSVDSYGNPAGGEFPFISADGNYVAFWSGGGNFVPGDTNEYADVFVRDRQTGTIERVSVDSYGNQGNGASAYPSISADGRYVAFYSGANNLVPGDTNGNFDIFVHDGLTGTTERVSVDSYGNQANYGSAFVPSISGDGRYVAFRSSASNLVPGDTNGVTTDVFVRDRQTGTTERVSEYAAGNQAISFDGRYVAFWSDASNLVPGDTNGYPDVFIHDRQTGITERVNVDNYGNQANGYGPGASIGILSLSSEGTYVAFDSDASNLVPGDTNGYQDVFVHNRFADADGDTFIYPNDCNDYDGTVFPGAPEVCDLKDNDCDSQIDEGCPINTYYLDADGDTFGNASSSISNTAPPSGYVTSNTDCNDYDNAVYPGAVEVKHDGIDQDCNGYDLTVDITTADYTARKDKLVVNATSTLGQTANLALDGYGPMIWIGNKWAITVEPAGGNPGTVTVSGIEGSESVTVTVR